MTTAGIKAGGPDKVRRVSEQVRFLTQLQRDVYASIVTYFKQELGCGGLVSTATGTSLTRDCLTLSNATLTPPVTQEQPYGFRVKDNRITDVGGAPLGVKNMSASVSLSFEGASETKVVALDENGYASDKPVNVSGDGVHAPLVIHLAQDAIYHVIERR